MRFITVIFIIVLLCIAIRAQPTLFTYQGKLNDNALAATGTYDFQFKLFDTAAGGTQFGATQTVTGVSVVNGIFTVQLDFGSAVFSGADRFLEIAVKRSADTGYTTLAPRQQITSAPYGIRSLTATNADNAANLGGLPASEYILTGDARLSDARNPLAGSNNYIQNTTVQQTPANFNISGSGTTGGTLSGNIVNSQTQYNIAGNRVLSVPDIGNTFAGLNTGLS